MYVLGYKPPPIPTEDIYLFLNAAQKVGIIEGTPLNNKENLDPIPALSLTWRSDWMRMWLPSWTMISINLFPLMKSEFEPRVLALKMPKPY
jgi:hypothetical protein